MDLLQILLTMAESSAKEFMKEISEQTAKEGLKQLSKESLKRVVLIGSADTLLVIGFKNIGLEGALREGIMQMGKQVALLGERVAFIGVTQEFRKQLVKDGIVSGGGKAVKYILPKAAEAGTIVSYGMKSNLAIEAVFVVGKTAWDVRQYAYGHKSGTEVAKNVVKYTASATVGAIGCAIGQALIPIPILGSLIGGVIGTTIGTALADRTLEHLSNSPVIPTYIYGLPKQNSENQK